MKITTQFLNKTYEHGSIEIVSRDGEEKHIDVSLELVVTDLDEFHAALQRLISQFSV